mgnify:CR=1 FL=1
MPESRQNSSILKSGFSEIDRVVADPLRFKLKLGIGEDAYASLRIKKNITNLWDLVSWGGTGATVAASPMVASAFFVPKGFMALIGFGTAVTPIGWVVAAAVTSAGAYYGVTRLFGGYEGSRVNKIPKFINTPLDVLGAALFDLMGGLAIRVANIDGQIDDRETQAIVDYFVGEWGFDSVYVDRALAVLRSNISMASIKDMSRNLAKFQAENPDCNDAAMQAELAQFLREIALADGVLDEREELAIDAIALAMSNATPDRRERLRKVARGMSGTARAAAGAVKEKLVGLELQRLVPRFRRRS